MICNIVDPLTQNRPISSNLTTIHYKSNHRLAHSDLCEIVIHKGRIIGNSRSRAEMVRAIPISEQEKILEQLRQYITTKLGVMIHRVSTSDDKIFFATDSRVCFVKKQVTGDLNAEHHANVVFYFVDVGK